MLPPAHKFASRMQSLGLGDGNRFVVYDNSPLHSGGAGLVDAEDLRRPLCRPARRRPAEMEGGGAAAGERAPSRIGTAISPPARRRRRSSTKRRCSALDGATRSSTRARRRASPAPRPSRARGWRRAISRARATRRRAISSTPTTLEAGRRAARRVRRRRRRPREADGDDLRLGRDRRVASVRRASARQGGRARSTTAAGPNGAPIPRRRRRQGAAA